MTITAGYDVGGAHLKVALAEDSRILAVRQIACPLWKGLETLDAALAEAAPLTERAERHAVTMTGELCELFADRRTGVAAILERLEGVLPPGIRIWMGPRGFGTNSDALVDPLSVASTNFLASATLVGRKVADALFIDMGSTTTDIIAIAGGKPAPLGLTDGERLATGELVYTGLTRTDVSVVAQQAAFRGRAQRLAAGGFANMADVRRILGTLAADVDQHATLDGRGTSVQESTARFARCFGRDAADAAPGDWRACARQVADRQIAEVRTAIQEVLAASTLPATAPIVAAGIGAVELGALAGTLGRPSIDFGTLVAAPPDCSPWATRCAPAVALALLAQTV
jgi:(4-(4-[2-(gamma-L-glutamylamino)ethyl]phenoxymethyl)furan-2-yl)methanamine synthase